MARESSIEAQQSTPQDGAWPTARLAAAHPRRRHRDPAGRARARRTSWRHTSARAAPGVLHAPRARGRPARDAWDGSPRRTRTAHLYKHSAPDARTRSRSYDGLHREPADSDRGKDRTDLIDEVFEARQANRTDAAPPLPSDSPPTHHWRPRPRAANDQSPDSRSTPTGRSPPGPSTIALPRGLQAARGGAACQAKLRLFGEVAPIRPRAHIAAGDAVLARSRVVPTAPAPGSRAAGSRDQLDQSSRPSPPGADRTPPERAPREGDSAHVGGGRQQRGPFVSKAPVPRRRWADPEVPVRRLGPVGSPRSATKLTIKDGPQPDSGRA